MSANDALIYAADSRASDPAADSVSPDSYPWFGVEEAMLPARQVVWLSLALIAASLAALLLG